MASSQYEYRYLDLISTDTKNHSGNTNSRFGNSLPQTLEFPQNTQVALQEIGYSPSFYNIELKNNDLLLYIRSLLVPPNSSKNPTPNEFWGQYAQVRLEAGFYKDLPSLIKHVNERIRAKGEVCKGLSKSTIFSYNDVNKKISFDFGALECSLIISGRLLYLFGIDLRETDLHKEWVAIGLGKKGKYYEVDDPTSPDLPKVKRYYVDPDKEWNPNPKGTFGHVAQLRSFSSLYIFSDIVQSQIFGSTYADLLRSISINTSQFDVEVVHECRMLHFLDLRKRFIKDINVIIQDIHGSPILFRQGGIPIRLVFKIPTSGDSSSI